ncbi:16S rRNA (cytidine(1402)-2'-O)-methyltransferase [Melioribacter sp. Ez-97]|uniref:16S rRNA (cytidine(1402)-2'-O)-methyltransferase n=1 Tax=Melioribacter sp. Ez-97 TaxID=3423434 RepID=UPI003ED9DF56
MAEKESGKIYVVATPIGNLKDITFRAVEVLKNVDFIVCEDTRVSGILLSHYCIEKRLKVLNARNESRTIDDIIEEVKSGKDCALISDAGTPLISDPGSRLINRAVAENITVAPAPGPSALTAALSISGLPSSSFVFDGFLPQKKGRQKKLEQLSRENRTIVLYESTYRIEKLLKELSEYMPERTVVVCRELTKKFEEVWRGKPSELLEELPSKNIKGEFVVIISPLEWREEDYSES